MKILMDPINCKYYSMEELKVIPRNKALHIFHSNVNGTHIDNLHEFLSNTNSLTETSQQTDLNFKTNVNMKGCLLMEVIVKKEE